MLFLICMRACVNDLDNDIIRKVVKFVNVTKVLSTVKDDMDKQNVQDERKVEEQAIVADHHMVAPNRQQAKF